MDNELDAIFKASKPVQNVVAITPVKSVSPVLPVVNDQPATKKRKREKPAVKANTTKGRAAEKGAMEEDDEAVDQAVSGTDDQPDQDQEQPKKRKPRGPRKDDALADQDESDVEEEEKKAVKETRVVDADKNERTVFVGNLGTGVMEKSFPYKPNLKKLKSLFSQYGPIESIRFRSIAFANTLPKKIAAAKMELHPGRDTLNAYVVYKEQVCKERVEEYQRGEKNQSAVKALALNTTVFEGKHIRVDGVSAKKTDTKKSVFLGNLGFDVSDEALWSFFADCGDIDHVRVVRDAKTNVGKGIGFVEFKERNSVELALKLDGELLAGRNVRVTRSRKHGDGGGAVGKKGAGGGKSLAGRVQKGRREGGVRKRIANKGMGKAGKKDVGKNKGKGKK
ncbi:Nucleolar protein 12 [Irineochytrium annulatum]|nr:Nucleolar protein 12 [Irineochytrium annulatum]